MKNVKFNAQLSFTHALLMFFFLMALTTLVYYSSLNYCFLFDDYPNIVKLFPIRHMTFGELFFAHSRWITFWLNTMYYALARFDPFFYRLGNLLIHLTNGTLLWASLMLLLGNLKQESFIKAYAHPIAYITAGLFLLHPVQTQTVCYVVQGQLEGCAALSILLMLFVFILFTRLHSFYAQFLSCLVLCLLAGLSSGTKEIAIVAPALLILTDWFFIAEGSWHSLKRRLWVHALIALIVISCFCYVLKPAFFFDLLQLKISRVSTTGNILTTDHEALIKPYYFLISQFKVLLHYMLIFFWPYPLSADYNWKLSEGFWTIDSLFPFLVLCCLVLWLIRRALRYPPDPLVFAFSWFFLSMLPRASLIPSAELVADYKTYIPSIGMVLILAIVLVTAMLKTINFFQTKIAQKVTYGLFWCSIALVLISKGYLAAYRTRVWRSPEDFWFDVITHSPKARSYNNYAYALIEKQKFVEAIPYLEKAIQLDHLYPDPWNNLAAVYGNLNKIDKAILALREVLRINPYHVEGYLNLATFLIMEKEYATADNALRHALALRPHYGKALFKLGQIQHFQGNIEKANAYYKKCCTQADLDNTYEGFAAWGMTCVSLKKYADALQAYTQAVKLNPHDDSLKMHLAYAHIFNKQYTQAEHLLKRLYTRHPSDIQIILALAEVLIVTKRYLAALTLYKKVPTHALSNPKIFLRMAGCCYKVRLFDEVEKYLTIFLSTNPPQELVAPVHRILKSLEKKDFSAKSWAWLSLN